MDVRRGLRSTCLVWLVALLYACGGDGEVLDLRDASYPEDTRGPDAGDGGDAGRRDGSVGGMDASTDAGADASADGSIDMDGSIDIDGSLGDGSAPTVDAGDVSPEVTVLSPSPSYDPRVDTVLTGSVVPVQCAARARRDGAEIAGVTIAIFDETSMETPKVQVPAVMADGGWANTMVSLAGLKTGRIRIRCTAVENYVDALAGRDEIETYYDGGPTVTFESPATAVVARGNNDTVDMLVRFRVTPVRLQPKPATDGGTDASTDSDAGTDADAATEPDGGAGNADPDADIDTVTLLVNEKVVPASASDVPNTVITPSDGVYTARVDFFTFFSQSPIDHATIEVIATNLRGVSVRQKLTVKVDGAGPAVMIFSPTKVEDTPKFVGGTVQIRATATDTPAGIGSASALIKTDNGDRPYGVMSYGGDTIGFDFEASSFSDQALIVAQLSVFDAVGNLTQQSLTMRVDTVAPWVSLDPPSVRMFTSDAKCSGSFDPLGASPVDGQVIQKQARFRALVWERATQIPGATEEYLAMVRNDSVDLVAQPYGAATDPSSGRQLLVDRDGDHVCDIVDDSTPTAGQLTPFRTRLKPVGTGGALTDAESIMSSVAWADPVPGFTCTGLQSGSTIPAKCVGSEMTYIVPHPADGSSVVYGYEPSSTGLACTGASMDFGGGAGWYCVTTVARDKSEPEGNLGIAPPIRVCRKLVPTDCGGMNPGDVITPPAGLTCTDGCTLPAAWTAPPMPSIVPQ